MDFYFKNAAQISSTSVKGGSANYSTNGHMPGQLKNLDNIMQIHIFCVLVARLALLLRVCTHIIPECVSKFKN